MLVTSAVTQSLLHGFQDLLWRQWGLELVLHPAAHPAALWRKCSQWNWGWKWQEGKCPEPHTRTSEDGRFCCMSHQPCVYTEKIWFQYVLQWLVTFISSEHMIWFMCSKMPPAILHQGNLSLAITVTCYAVGRGQTCPALVDCWWWNKWGHSLSPADPKSSEQPGWLSSRWSDKSHQSGSHTCLAKQDKGP